MGSALPAVDADVDALVTGMAKNEGLAFVVGKPLMHGQKHLD